MSGSGYAQGVDMSGGRYHPLNIRSEGGGYPSPALDMGLGIPQDTVGKWVVCILLECFLVSKWL